MLRSQVNIIILKIDGSEQTFMTRTGNARNGNKKNYFLAKSNKGKETKNNSRETPMKHDEISTRKL